MERPLSGYVSVNIELRIMYIMSNIGKGLKKADLDVS